MDSFPKNISDRKRAVVDASSAIILYKAVLFGHLVQTYHVFMTASVIEEVTRNGYPGAGFFREMARRPAITIVPSGHRTALRHSCDRHLFSLDRGERDTIGYLIDGCAEFVIIDDGRGSNYCRINSLPFINALLFPRILLLSQRLTPAACTEKMAKIIQNGRYSQRIIAAAGSMGSNELRPFLPRQA